MKNDIKTKILSASIKIPFQVLINSLLPKFLSINNYGAYDLVLSIGQRIYSLIEGGSLTAFYIRYSKNNEKGFLSYYLKYVIYSIIISVIVFFILYAINFLRYDKIGLSITEFILFIIYLWLLFVINFLTKVYDASNKTKIIEIVKVIIFIISSLFLITLLFFNYYNDFRLLLIFNIIIYGLFSAFLLYKIEGINIFNKNKKKDYKKYLINYTKPLYLYLLISTLSIILGRIILQYYGDNLFQALYGLSFKIVTVFIVLMSSVVPILTREFSKSLNDFKKFKLLLNESFVYISLIGIFFFFFIFIFSEKLLILFGGVDYLIASNSLKVLGFVPLIQTLNQILGSYYYSRNEVKSFSKKGILASIFSITLLYIMFVHLNEYFEGDFSLLLAISYLGGQIIRFIILFSGIKLKFILSKNE
tara:strand:+ start:4129 stop:5382 length:1254 start_codon:yes stop_codon:yes gene_type:complete